MSSSASAVSSAPRRVRCQASLARQLASRGAWPNATIAAIAKEAGVSKESVYAIFGTKVALIAEMVKASVAEAAPGEHFLDQERPRAISATADPGRQIELWAVYFTEIMQRVSPLMTVVRAGAEAEPEMSETYRALHQGRRANLSCVAQSILDKGGTKAGLTVETATDVFWQLASPEMFTLLTGVGGYSTERYAEWLAEMLKAALLESRQG